MRVGVNMSVVLLLNYYLIEKHTLHTLFNFSLTTKLIISAELPWSFPKFVVVQANKNDSIF